MRSTLALLLLTLCTLCATELLAGEPVVLDGGKQPQVAVAPDGTVHVAMIKGGNIVVVSSRDRGKTFSAPVVAIDASGKARGGRRRGPRIGVDRKGHLVLTAPVCFDPNEFSRRYPRADLYLTRSATGGKTWSKPVRVNAVDKAASESLHWLAVAPSGDAHVSWLDHRLKKMNMLWYARVTGDEVGKNVRLTGAVCECCAPGMSVDGKGNPWIVVRDRGSGDRGVLFTRSKNQGRSFRPPTPVNSRPTGVFG